MYLLFICLQANIRGGNNHQKQILENHNVTIGSNGYFKVLIGRFRVCIFLASVAISQKKVLSLWARYRS